MSKALSDLRAKYPNISQRGFAAQVYTRSFESHTDRCTASEVTGSPASIYARVRRLDTANKARTPEAVPA